MDSYHNKFTGHAVVYMRIFSLFHSRVFKKVKKEKKMKKRKKRQVSETQCWIFKLHRLVMYSDSFETFRLINKGDEVAMVLVIDFFWE